MRTCIVTRQCLNHDQLIRFVRDPDDNVIVDLKEKLPGRGLWVINSKDAVDQAYKKRLFQVGFKQSVEVSETIAHEVKELLLENIRQNLAIAKKSGLVISGFSKVEPLARNGKISVLIHASDARPDGKEKINSALIAGQLAGGYKKALPKPFLTLSAAQLDRTLGANNTVHIALLKGGASVSVKMNIRRFEQYCET